MSVSSISFYLMIYIFVSIIIYVNCDSNQYTIRKCNKSHTGKNERKKLFVLIFFEFATNISIVIHEMRIKANNRHMTMLKELELRVTSGNYYDF